MKDTVIIPWNNIYLEAVRKFGGAPGPIARIGAMMHIAMFDAINALSGNPYKSYLSNLPDTVKGADPAMSAAYAARKVLLQTIDTLINQAATSPGGVPNPFEPHQLNAGFDPKSFLDDWSKRFNMTWEKDDPSQKFGEAVAEAILLEREKDGSEKANDSPAVEFGFTPGDWRETGSGAAVTPQWGKVNPFGGWQTSQINDFLPTTALNVSKFSNYSELLPGRDYAGQIKEVQRLGEAHSSERTREQTEIAFFWANDVNGTSKPPGQLYTITQIVAKQEGTVQSLLETARLFALVSIAMADAAIVAWYVKYLFPQENDENNLIRLWRPETAIREADTDNNPDTTPDRHWQPLSAMTDGTRFSPAFPAYISGHATFGAAHAAMMRLFFARDSISFTATTEDPNALRDENGVKLTRTFTSFTEAARENGRSRVYLGVHYQWDAEGGFESGTKVGEFAFNRLSDSSSGQQRQSR
ncbi:phosphoesterase PA-phosphatase [Scytonema hofmannii PCC 7110]|uniref:Phosphoesterase PA-phosphatase n=1 Tax=Scytonema hofmannii PCC 7110 TaxID=128403 RepID=A0A139WV70_9CYAN|nr:vanadium-dependent haloperoxidase [Scytonema hofmannii]KYC36332.1 phosphoesterase PA-phosphatase [Scytonema hofmannii PCC 7110]